MKMLENLPRATAEQKLNAAYEALSTEVQTANAAYPYWDKVKTMPLRQFSTHNELWFALKALRRLNRTELQFGNYAFSFTITEEMMTLLHYFDLNLRGTLPNEPFLSAENKKTHLVSALMEEAIASSQLDGATTNRHNAKTLLRKNEKPKNVSEQMIFNNYQTLNAMKKFEQTDFSVRKLFAIHHSLTNKTLQNLEETRTFRNHDEVVFWDSERGEVVQVPPSYEHLEFLIADLETFFNREGKTFIHPIIKAIIIHFMTAYIYPFNEGNGRVARALFHWYMLKNGYALTEFVSVSHFINKSKAAYEKAFLYAEMDDHDLTYFILYHLRTLKKAVEEFQLYLKRKSEEDSTGEILGRIHGISARQAQIIEIIMDNPTARLSVKEIETRFSISNFSARSDLEGLVKMEFLTFIMVNKIKRVYVKSLAFDDMIQKATEVYEIKYLESLKNNRK